MAARSKARKRALDILFESEQRGLPTLELLAERQSLGEQPVPQYAADLVRGVASHSERIDALISWNLVDWTLERMPAVDRNVLRLGVYELLWADDVPDGVAISEAVALAEDLSTDASPSFVNGVLARLGMTKASQPAEPSASPTYLGRFLWPRCAEGGWWAPAVKAGDTVKQGQVIGTVSSLDGAIVKETVTAPADGVVIFVTSSPAVADDGLLLGLGAA